MTYRARSRGASIIEVPISFKDRERGESKMSQRIVVEALILVTKWAAERWYHLGKSGYQKARALRR
jgi:dolichol-phosphate mannosyltransferase